jgi:hypothetical protein
MRRRLSSVRRILVATGLLVATWRAAVAQTGVAVEGGTEFLLPTGARGLGAAQAIVASGVGAEAIWWNPALIAHGPREAAFNIAQQANGVIVADASGAVVWPVPRVGAFALTVRYLNEGDQPSVNDQQQVVGSFDFTGVVAAGTFATQFGNQLSAGLTLKLLWLTTGCTGTCDLPSSSPRTGAIDFGARYFVTKDSLIAIGVSGLNVGLPLQVNDSPQADRLPSRADIGVAISPKFSQMPKEVHLQAEADMVKRLSGGGPGYRFGGEVRWQDLYAARVGYQLNGPTGSGPTFGLGFAAGKLHVDFAQMLTDVGGVGAGKPTFLSLRYLF